MAELHKTNITVEVVLVTQSQLKIPFFSALWTLPTTPLPTSVAANLSKQAAAKLFVKGSIYL